MKPSVEKATKYFKERCLPRRVRDIVAEEEDYRKHDRKRAIYRRVLEDEVDRGELYPVCSAGFQTFSNFGIGVGIYFTHLLLLGGLFFVCGFLMIAICKQYNASNYGDPNETNSFIQISAACPATINVIATLGCDGNTPSCTIKYRPNCDVPSYPFVIDMAMSVLFGVALFVSAIVDRRVTEELDESIQTAQDYSVVVLDPDSDADNPDEWYDYFSRFGMVKCITIVRNNQSLLQLILKQHKLDLRIQELTTLWARSNQNNLTSLAIIASNHTLYTTQLNKLRAEKEKLLEQLQKVYLLPKPVAKVYVTFEYEQHQKLCIATTEVPDLYAIFDIRDYAHTKYLFRNTNVLFIEEAAEPDNILWPNIGIPREQQWIRRGIAELLTVALLVATWFIIAAYDTASNTSTAFIIGVIDTLLPSIFDSLISFTRPYQESKKQSVLQIRLFAARLLLSSFIPYWQTPWSHALERDNISQLISIQFTACFMSSCIGLMDISGLINHYLLAPLFAKNQYQYNLYWSGTNWSLAEKYTVVIKIICVTVLYSVLIPFSLLFGMVAFLVIFCIDRFLLLRRWRQVPLLGNELAVRLRQQGLFAIAAHMYITYRFLHSWPMDQALLHTTSDLEGKNLFTYLNGSWQLIPEAVGKVIFEKVDKFPDYNIYSLSVKADWHNANQKAYLPAYLACFTIILVITLLIWVIMPAIQAIRKLFCQRLRVSGESQGIPFSDLTNVTIYDPLVYHPATKRLHQCSYAPTVPARLRKRFVHPEISPDEGTTGTAAAEAVLGEEKMIDDVSVYVPELHQPYVLSIIKYYPSEIEMKERKQQSNRSVVTALKKEADEKLVAKNKRESKQSEGDIENNLLRNNNNKIGGDGETSKQSDDKLAPKEGTKGRYDNEEDDDDEEDYYPRRRIIRKQAKSVRFEHTSYQSMPAQQPQSSLASSIKSTSMEHILIGLDENDHDDEPVLPLALQAKLMPREVKAQSSSNAFSKPRRYISPDSNTAFTDLEGNKKFMVTSLDL